MINYKGYDIPDTIEEINIYVSDSIANNMSQAIAPTIIYKFYNIKSNSKVTINTGITIEEFANAKTDEEKQNIINNFISAIEEFIDHFTE